MRLNWPNCNSLALLMRSVDRLVVSFSNHRSRPSYRIAMTPLSGPLAEVKKKKVMSFPGSPILHDSYCLVAAQKA